MLLRPRHLIPPLSALMLLGLLNTATSQAQAAPSGAGTQTVSNTALATDGNLIAFVGGSRAAANLKVPSVTVPAPVQAGDTLLLTASLADVTSVAVPAGWTLVGNQSAASLRSVVWSRIATTSDTGTSVKVTLNAIRKAALTLTAYRGVDPAAPVSAQASSDASTSTHVTPAVTAPAGSWAVSYWADKGTSTTRWTTPSTASRRTDAYTTGSGRVTAAIADSNGPRSGSLPAMTATTDATSARAVNWAITLPARNLPPVAEFGFHCQDLTCDFDASATTDSDGTIASYGWDFGDVATASGSTSSHTFAKAGTYQVQLTATDNDGATANKVASVTVTEPAPAPETLFGFWAGADTSGGGEGTRANYDRVKSYLGAPEVYRMFFSGSPGTNFVGSNADFGPPVVASFKFAPQEVVTGQHDATLKAWFASIPADQQVWWSYFHEPENDIEAGAFTTAQYRAAWTHILNLAPKQENLHPTLILMRYTLSIPTRRTVDWYVVPGLEVLCWDSYLTGGLTMKQVIDDPAAVSERFGLDFAIGEISAKDPARIDQFVKDMMPAARAQDAKFVTWFETNKAGLGVNEADWRMRPHSAAVTAWSTP